ncbi:ATP synthase F1 subunit epsilon [Microscilla marina]|uniref:ATP synthase, Delta/Epsilon chain, beta-sandwich domain n=1 Tax=Microscilla marina ATCC 23134 TaxID=313606 RepID=A1ZPD4_MICM2|nr:ATP synthase F1 subunit epsilon [Microscilla marina]EAY27673.1 ATP synthase, Delta/Epsilon chain, beta-sandwich domain [Microscilla marina ATCC 23134]
MQVKIITPDKTAFEGEAQAITFPGNSGEFEVLDQHAAMISLLKKGNMRLKAGGKDQNFNIDGGVVEVLNNKVVVLVESIEDAQQGVEA